MASQTEEQLNLVDLAITKILVGQVSNYQIKGRMATYLDLKDLRELRNELRLRLSRETAAQEGRKQNIGIQWGRPQ